MIKHIPTAFRRLKPGKLGTTAATVTLAAALVAAGASTEAYHDQHTIGGSVANDSAVVMKLSTDDVNFSQSNVVSASLSGLEAGDTQHVKIWAQNGGEAQWTLDAASLANVGAALDGSLGGNPDTVSFDQNYVGVTADPGQTIELDLTVTDPSDQDQDAYGGATGSYTVTLDAVNSSHYVAPGI